MTDSEEKAYERGHQQAWRGILSQALGELAPYRDGEVVDDAVRAGRALSQLHDARNALRRLFSELELDWPGDELHLGDVVRLLGRELVEPMPQGEPIIEAHIGECRSTAPVRVRRPI